MGLRKLRENRSIPKIQPYCPPLQKGAEPIISLLQEPGHGGSPPALFGLLGSVRRGLRPYLLVVRTSANHHSSRLVTHSHTQHVRAQECDCTRMRRNQRGDLHRDRQHNVPYHWVRGPDARQLGQIQPGVLPDFNGILDSMSNPSETEVACYAEALQPGFVNRICKQNLKLRCASPDVERLLF